MAFLKKILKDKPVDKTEDAPPSALGSAGSLTLRSTAPASTYEDEPLTVRNMIDQRS